MKALTNSLLMTVIALLAFAVVGCKNTNNNGATASISPSPVATAATPKSPEPQEITFVEASSQGPIDYRLSGMEEATSDKMHVEIRNKTERVWELKIEAGTKLEPSDGNVQHMVVTKERHVHLEPHDESSLDLDVSCLDITKETPSRSDVTWTITKSQKLAQFIDCANHAIDQLKLDDPASAEELEKDRAGTIQHAIWQARGASREDWIHFAKRYDSDSKSMTDEQIGDAVDEHVKELQPIISKCQSLVSL
jgi:hypothetical protein